MNKFPALPRTLSIALLLGTGLLAGCVSGGSFNPRPVSQQRNMDGTSDLRIADSALKAGDVELATTLYERALTANPDSLAAQLGLGDAMYLAGDMEKARALYQRAAQQTPMNPAAKLGLARVALRQRRLDTALALYRGLLVAQPDNPVFCEGLGTVLDLQGRHADAQVVYRAALASHPEVQGLRVNLGLSLILDNKLREAANTLLDVAGLSDSPVQARQNLALAYGLLGNSDAARKILLVDLPPSSADDNLRFYRTLRDRLAGNHADAVHNDGNATTASALPRYIKAPK
ncbi:lipopolysaccharide assembly protein LapB [Pandoraea sp. B-6]|uniref:tetratricopeptide repeat protein n=1 Tax=Pandoraea sp. B-6 TaxID=1204340 RepID=UPI00034BCE4A|nr:tetratricopeptide repeat protein [Pandoraea sp. B-6]